MNKRTHCSKDQLSTSRSIEILQEIVRNCQINEQRLHELELRTKSERKKAERILKEKYETRQRKPVEFFVPFDVDDNSQHRRIKSSYHRVRFNIPEKTTNDSNSYVKQKSNLTKSTLEDDLADLSRRCNELLSRLHLNHPHEESITISPTQKRMERIKDRRDQPLQQCLMNEIQRSNSIRAKIFRTRLRQHVLMHGRTNIDQSLSVMDM